MCVAGLNSYLRFFEEIFMNNDLFLVIDMQNIYAAGQKWACMDTEGVAERTLRVIDAMERLGNDQIIFTRFLAAEQPEGVWADYNERYADINASAWENEMLPQLADPLKKYPLYTKNVYSSLAIPEVLSAAKKADRVVVAGVVAECCVLSTVLALIDAGIYVIYLTDAVSGFDKEKEAATETILSGLSPLHVRLMTVEEYLSCND
jgi:nicotinamidase-related amidase